MGRRVLRDGRLGRTEVLLGRQEIAPKPHRGWRRVGREVRGRGRCGRGGLGRGEVWAEISVLAANGGGGDGGGGAGGSGAMRVREAAVTSQATSVPQPSYPSAVIIVLLKAVAEDKWHLAELHPPDVASHATRGFARLHLLHPQYNINTDGG